MDVAVPGGQLVYVAKDGGLHYTSPHSGGMPSGAVTAPFNYTAQSESGTVGKLTFEDDDWIACPTRSTTTSGSYVETVYQVYAASRFATGWQVTPLNCEGIAWGTTTFDGEIAYEYSP